MTNIFFIYAISVPEILTKNIMLIYNKVFKFQQITKVIKSEWNVTQYYM